MPGGRVSGRIVETEAYLGRDDPASHAYRGRRHEGNRAIYSPPSTWYVYRSYGIHWCANLVVGPLGEGAAVLLRAVAIRDGLEVAAVRRGPVDPRRLSDGPGKLCTALGIDRRLDDQPMGRSRVVISVGEPAAAAAVRVTPRIGITKAADWPLRFLLEEEGGGPVRNRPPGTAVEPGQ
jgi:DNA-3-methyladenine glycosylase